MFSLIKPFALPISGNVTNKKDIINTAVKPDQNLKNKILIKEG